MRLCSQAIEMADIPIDSLESIPFVCKVIHCKEFCQQPDCVAETRSCWWHCLDSSWNLSIASIIFWSFSSDFVIASCCAFNSWMISLSSSWSPTCKSVAPRFLCPLFTLIYAYFLMFDACSCCCSWCFIVGYFLLFFSVAALTQLTAGPPEHLNWHHLYFVWLFHVQPGVSLYLSNLKTHP